MSLLRSVRYLITLKGKYNHAFSILYIKNLKLLLIVTRKYYESVTVYILVALLMELEISCFEGGQKLSRKSHFSKRVYQPQLIKKSELSYTIFKSQVLT